jgi:hypothetical protein
MRLVFVGLVASSLLVGCGSPLVGDWESDKKLPNGDRNEMSILSDGTGDAKIFATPQSQPDNWVEFKFDLEWAEDAEEFDVDMNCKKGPCDSDDFKMTCVVVDEGDGSVYKLECKVTKNARWENYPFGFEKLE